VHYHKHNFETANPYVLALGAIILADYGRLHFADKLAQQKHFRSQLAIAKKYFLLLFLHSRAAHKDFVPILTEEGLADDSGRKVGAGGGCRAQFQRHCRRNPRTGVVAHNSISFVRQI
jgi:Tat protein secretion system quality control protein TatD with DNase activity